MVQICVWFDRPLERTRFVTKCKGKPLLGHVSVSVLHVFSIVSESKAGRGFDELRVPGSDYVWPHFDHSEGTVAKAPGWRRWRWKWQL